MTALQLLKDQLKDARKNFEATVGDLTQDQLHQNPGGKALPVGAQYAHLICSEDTIIHGMLQGKPSLSETTFKDKTGLSEPMPAMDAEWSEANEKWSKNVQIDLSQLQEYSKAVYVATDEYIDSLKEEDLDREIDLGGFGKYTTAQILSGFVIGHTNSLMGEISALKGLQGLKGYPF
jgi:hypothetical protein